MLGGRAGESEGKRRGEDKGGISRTDVGEIEHTGGKGDDLKSWRESGGRKAR